MVSILLCDHVDVVSNLIRTSNNNVDIVIGMTLDMFIVSSIDSFTFFVENSSLRRGGETRRKNGVLRKSSSNPHPEGRKMQSKNALHFRLASAHSIEDMEDKFRCQNILPVIPSALGRIAERLCALALMF